MFKKNKNLEICLHTKISKKIKNIVLSSLMISTALFINMFHIPFHIHGLEFEKIEFGIIILYSMIGIINWKIIMTAAAFLPLLDLMLHGHLIYLLIPEMISNILIIFFAILFWKLFLKGKEKHYKNFVFFILIFFLTLAIRIINYLAIVYVFLPKFYPEVNDEWKKINNINQILPLFIPIFVLAILKYSIIFSSTLIIKNKIDNKYYFYN